MRMQIDVEVLQHVGGDAGTFFDQAQQHVFREITAPPWPETVAAAKAIRHQRRSS